ncbi:hypothetical protein [Dyella mobilis]|uniref:Uncharacterized protein n=1 Tax=Dyella mobilis TaxID=1849582 RepID=A0ABS2KFU9_9GAMM|nr:hypothetical protein [Dyella mobilis]MBM7129974.1 hypothetical protein [Dyella mobilis]GLQ97763.1 hypothetical protein GCM10007863_21830 [Dyella mobilis]
MISKEKSRLSIFFFASLSVTGIGVHAQERTVTVCDLLKSPNSFEGQSVALSANLVLGPHGGYLLDEHCNSLGGLRLIVSDGDDDNRKVRDMMRWVMANHGHGRVKLEGAFQSKTDPETSGSFLFKRVLSYGDDVH